MNMDTALKYKIRRARKGLNIFYYGSGKGKTSAVMGLAARALGAGLNVLILQFVKSKQPRKGGKLRSGEWPVSSEVIFFNSLKPQQGIGKIKTYALGAGFVGILGDKKQRATHVLAAKKGLALARKLIAADKYDLIILDELISALELRLLPENEILKLINQKPKHVYLAYTGHEKFPAIAARSDIVSEVRMIKHPYYRGMLAQRGIDF